MTIATMVNQLETRYPDIWRLIDEIVTPESYFELFKGLSDNYSPTLTVTRVQGPNVRKLLAGKGNPDNPIKIDTNLRGSGTIGLTIGAEPAPIWLSGHSDICSYLTGPYDKTNGWYPLTPFCMTRARPGPRPAVALAIPDGEGPLTRLAYGDMVTLENGDTVFATADTTLPLWTRIVYHLDASWNQTTDEMHGYHDNQGSCAALLLAAQVLSHYDVNVLLLLNDEEEGPVDKGNQGFSRALNRLLHRTPYEQMPEAVVVSDGHSTTPAGTASSMFGKGALYNGFSSKARGAIVPPQLVGFLRDLAPSLAARGINLVENPSYVGRSDDISAMQFTQNVMLIGFAATSSHFDEIPTTHCSDLVNLTKTLIVTALLAQDDSWRTHYL